ncbi:MAG TPA: electron transfer flavoprotein subunit beta/FixA family protein [Pyrinomonadaceae bacterium]|nr:electron transfer flavoprotein subunit beta/FixA family protein [Chloracidobacterium sp.]MBP9935665.1 electron transfer flavoprotein subunit beta/FixA family protein [Pyrinomonadaceae bacterium]MBK7802680.1 electron transfer flavoprotein subunit beta/FixA family protein [Chloracidobacterium sp.]MBK9437535.1 electron transfer flavoprotein subunit beta/FixA family protein [Chloracidobacterium sp.]MBK9767108.1 electron transfer flavoprotein subunit beta/FixA family protein [Chloracidobacterium 
MKIIVLMKQVANKDAVLRIAADEKWINEADISQQTNESDGYALEEALRTVEAKGGGEVVVCSLGPQSAKTVIKDALARGADRAIHVVVDDSKSLSSYQIARAIADAIREENADLVFTGLQSDDASYGQTGVILAELLGIPHATIVIEVEKASIGESIRVKRELESGWYQWFTYKLPSLLTIQSGISQIRYASLKGIMAAKKKEIREVTPTLDAFASAAKIEKVYLPLKSKQTQMLGNGDAKAGAVELVEKLKNEVRVI